VCNLPNNLLQKHYSLLISTCPLVCFAEPTLTISTYTEHHHDKT